MPRVALPLIDLFMRRVDRSGDHWLWTGPVARKDGYPMFNFRDPELRKVVSRSAHRWIYQYTFGPLPEGWTVDHVCRVILCVKPHPKHLEGVPHRENLMRAPTSQAARNAAKTHCDNGHEFTPANTYIKPKNGARGCKACRRDAGRRYEARKRAGK